MAILKIARMGHPTLMRIADPISDARAPAVQQLVADMIDTMVDAPGIGLAAPQVHVPARIVVFRVPDERGEDGEGVPLTVLINPEIEPLDDEMETGIEGCLSLPGMAGMLPRHTRIRYRATGLDGEVFERTVEGYHARVVQHECDHLDGILYPMRMTDLSTLGYAEEMSKSAEAGYTDDEDDGDSEPHEAIDEQ